MGKTTCQSGKMMQTAKQTARQVIEHLPNLASWDDIMYELYVQQKIDKGLEAVKQGNHVSDEEARKRLLSQYAGFFPLSIIFDML